MQKKMYMIPQVEEVFFTPKGDICQWEEHPQGELSGFLACSVPE